MNLTNTILLGLVIILTACVYFLDRQNDALREMLKNKEKEEEDEGNKTL